MAEYIERDVAAAFAYNCGAVYVSNRLSDKSAFPAADVAPVRHGRWRFCGSGRWNDAYERDKCGKMATDNSNYCPNCGARMDGEGE